LKKTIRIFPNLFGGVGVTQQLSVEVGLLAGKLTSLQLEHDLLLEKHMDLIKQLNSKHESISRALLLLMEHVEDRCGSIY
jgi:hypothetical protein